MKTINELNTCRHLRLLLHTKQERDFDYADCYHVALDYAHAGNTDSAEIWIEKATELYLSGVTGDQVYELAEQIRIKKAVKNKRYQ